MRQKQRLAVLIGAAALAAAAPPAAEASTPFKTVNTSLAAHQSDLGKKSAKDLTKRVKKARAAYSQRRWCASVKELSGVVNATKRYHDPAKSAAGVEIAEAARAAQQTIFLAHAKKTKSCGLKAPKVRVAKLKHETKSLRGVAGGPARPVDALKGAGATVEFVRDEVVVLSNDQAAVERFAKRWKGKVLEHHDATPQTTDTWLLEIDPSGADTAGLPGDLRRLDPAARGSAKLSDKQALRLLAVVADAATHGLKVSLNTIVDSAAVEDRTTTEGTASGFTPDGFSPWYNATGGGIETGEAWRTLRIAGAAGKHVKLAVVDGGFATTSQTIADFGVRTGDWGQGQNNMQCSGGAGCPWHGTNVSSTAAGVVDNGAGVAGTGGEVADVQAVQMAGPTMFNAIDAVYEAFEAGAKVINISSGYEMDALVSFINVPYEDATQEAREQGALVVASAGNDGRDVDAEDCFIVCWEEEWIAPCENDAVLCVGGVTADRKRASGSNYGYEWTENAKTSDVDIFAPFTTWVGPDGSNTTNRMVNGTSFSSPFVAGVAAMMLAANPSLTPAKLEQGLKESAGGSPDKFVSRIVNADAAVKWAFPSSVFPPMVKIDPSSEKSGPYGGFGGLKLKASTYTVYSGSGCCSLAWTSPLDGLLGTGAEIMATLSSPGPRTVTVKATDGQKLSATDTIELTGTNQGPSLKVTTPATGQVLFHGVPSKFLASASDPNQFGDSMCSSITWKVTGTGLPTQNGVGCQPEFTFAANGARQLTVTVTDDHGATSSSSRPFTVGDPPLNAPPIVAILSPDANASLAPNTSHTLKASAIDPDGTTTPVGTWSVKNGSTTTTIGTGNQISWKPADHVGFHCGGTSVTLIFTASDPNGPSTAELPVFIPYPVC